MITFNFCFFAKDRLSNRPSPNTLASIACSVYCSVTHMVLESYATGFSSCKGTALTILRFVD